MPDPDPTTRPQSRTICHGAVIRLVAAVPIARISSAPQTERRRPNRSMIATANGPIIPYRKILSAMPTPIVAAVQPNSRSQGTISTLGVARTPAPTSRTRKVTATTVQA
jgi:hypothetical protein